MGTGLADLTDDTNRNSRRIGGVYDCGVEEEVVLRRAPIAGPKAVTSKTPSQPSKTWRTLLRPHGLRG
jgi:hypothetical protein